MNLTWRVVTHYVYHSPTTTLQLEPLEGTYLPPL